MKSQSTFKYTSGLQSKQGMILFLYLFVKSCFFVQFNVTYHLLKREKDKIGINVYYKYYNMLKYVLI